MGIVAAVALVAGVVAVLQISSLNTRLSEAREAAEEAEAEAEEANEELDDVEDELADATQRVREMRRATREAQQAQTLEGALAAGTAVAVSGLTAEVSDFDCVDRSCTAIQGTATFKNETQTGSAVTCVFRVEHVDGESSHFSWYVEYVPPKEQAISDLYYTSLYESPADYWYDSDECYRGVATFNPAPGDI